MTYGTNELRPTSCFTEKGRFHTYQVMYNRQLRLDCEKQNPDSLILMT